MSTEANLTVQKLWIYCTMLPLPMSSLPAALESGISGVLDSDNLPEPDVIASEIAEDLRSVLEQMEAMLGDLEPARSPS
jgi:hypothetical protein